MKISQMCQAMVAVLLLSTAVVQVATAQPADARTFPETGYRIDDDAFWTYFQQRGGVRTFGYPASHKFMFLGCGAQFFQRLVMQRCGEGGVGTLNLLDEGLLPYTTIGGSVFPGPSDILTSTAPRPDDPNYGSAIVAFVRANAPDTFEGEPVNFGGTFFDSITAELAGTDDPTILGLLDLEVWGLPTSQPAYEPTNRNFIYQRFQRGIMHYDRGCSCTKGLLLADYLKAMITGKDLPPDLESQASENRLLRSAVNGNVPPGTDYGGAFDELPVVAQPGVDHTREATDTPAPTNMPAATNTPAPTSTPAPASTATSIPVPPLSRNDPPPGSVAQNLGVSEPIGSASCSSFTGSPLSLGVLQSDQGQTNSADSEAFAFPALPTVCFTSVPSGITQLQMKASVLSNPSAVVASQEVTLSPNTTGWFWPVPNTADPPPAVGDYSVTASAPATAALPGGATSLPVKVSVVEPKKPHALVLPRKAAAGATFQIYLGGLKGAKSPVFLRIYKCTQALANCRSANAGSTNFTFVTSLGPLQVDGSGHATYSLSSRAGDPATEFVVLTDDMLANFSGVFGEGRAWFCTTTSSDCATE